MIVSSDKGKVDKLMLSELIAKIYEDELPVQDLCTLFKSNCSNEEKNSFAAKCFELSTSIPCKDDRFLDYFRQLIVCDFLSWPEVIDIVTSFDSLSRHSNVSRVCTLLKEFRQSIRCEYSNDDACIAFAHAIFKFFQWMINSLFKCETDCYTLSRDHFFSLFRIFIEDKFIFSILQTRSAIYPDDISSLIELSYKLCELNVNHSNFVFIYHQMQRAAIEPAYVPQDHLHDYLFKKCPMMSTICAVFARSRVDSSVEEMAEAISMCGTTSRMSNFDSLKYILRCSWSILLDEMDQERRGPYCYVSELFCFAKLPLLLKILVNEKGFSYDDLFRALYFNAWNSRPALDEMQTFVGTDLWRIFLNKLLSEGLITKDATKILIEKREREPNKREMKSAKWKLCTESALKGRKSIFDVMKSQKGGADSTMNIVLSLSKSNCVALDSLCAGLCVQDDISVFSSYLASLNRQAERSNTSRVPSDQRRQCFEWTFCQLSRIAFNFGQISLRELVNGKGDARENTNGCFYKWARRYLRRDSRPLMNFNLCDEVTEEAIVQAESRLSALMNGSIMDEDPNVDLSQIIESIPSIGHLIMKDRYHDVQVVLSTLRNSLSLLMALIQWLHSQRHTPRTQMLAKSLLGTLTGPPPREQEGWVFLTETCTPLLEEMVAGPPIADPITLIGHTFCHLPQPQFILGEVPDKEKLKKVLASALMNAGALPFELNFIQLCNQASEHQRWVESFLYQALKQLTNDSQLEIGEIVLATSLLDPLPSLRSICHILGDLCFPPIDALNENDLSSAVSPTLGMFRARIVAMAMVLSVWALDEAEKKLAHYPKKEVMKKEHREGEMEMDEIDAVPIDIDDDIGMMREHAIELRQTLHVMFNRMNTLIMETCTLNYATSKILLALMEIANLPRTSASEKLLKMVPHEMLFTLGRIDPQTMTLQLFCHFVHATSTEFKLKRLKFACLTGKSYY